VDRGDWERTAAIYLPLTAAILAGWLRGRRPRQFAACLLSLLWTLPTLLMLQQMNAWAKWWIFLPSAATFRDMPLELFLGWSILWGLVPELVFPGLPLVASVAVMVAIDCLLMPLCNASVHLGPHWFVGEVIGVGLVLLPGLCLARWTRQNTHLSKRAALQLVISALLFLFLLPEVCFALRPGAGWTPLLTMPGWLRQLALQVILLLALPGIAAVVEFAQSGQGTPIPYDPPTRLVTSGIYRYCANPMQVSCALVMLVWAGLLRNDWLLLASLIAIVYSAGIADWDEAQDLQLRFGQDWQDYRSQVRNWLPRWRPYHGGPPAILYLGSTCLPCSQVRSWLEIRKPLGLRILDAETLPAGSIRRMRYQTSTGAVNGIRAMGKALEHLHLGWALAGAAMRLPGIWQLIQLIMDASGLGPRLLEHQPRSLES
jgi:protein-S-isoprenylcysteine O-methyltransferase Ste14